jgi:uncharacterized protein YdcH (DUF465 family)
MWSLFGKIMSYDFPERFSKVLTKEQYAEILKIISQHFKTKRVKHEYLGDGIFNFEDEQKWQGQLGVDNIIRTIIKKDHLDWKDEIAEFLDNYKVDEDNLEFLYKNFDDAKPFLRVLVKPDSFDLSRPDSKQVFRIDFPETYSLLTLELDGRFLFLTEDNVKHWNRSVSELFKIALDNTPYDEIKIIQIKMEFEVAEDYLMIYYFSSGDFSATAMLDLANGFNTGVGKYGSLVAIPSKGNAYCHPIEGDNILRLTYPITKMAKAQFEEDPGQINLNFYWIYCNHIEKIVTKPDSESGYKMPNKLLDLLQPN